MHRYPSSPSIRMWLLAAVLALAGARGFAQELRLPTEGRLGALRRDRRHRDREHRAVRRGQADGRVPREVSLRVRDHVSATTSTAAPAARGLQTKFEQPYARSIVGEGEVLRHARQPRQPDRAQLQGLEHGRAALLHVAAPRGGLAKIGSPGVRFFALDSNYMDKPQLDWLESELKKSELGVEDRRSSITRSTPRARRTARRSTCGRCSSRCS